MTTAMIQCDNKGCYESDYHKLDPETDNVYCSKCNQVIKNISTYMKKTLLAQKQTFTRVKAANSFKCKECGWEDSPILLDYGNNQYEAACSKCKTADNHLTSYFTNVLKMNSEIRKVKVTFDEGSEGPTYTEQETPGGKVDRQESFGQTSLKGKSFPKNSWLSPKKEDRGPAPAGNVDQSQVESLQQDKPISMSMTGGPSTRKHKVATAKELLDRVGMNYVGDEVCDEPEEVDIMEPVNNGQDIKTRPASAIDMLKRVNVKIATDVV